MPSWEVFEQQPQAYRDSVLPPEVIARVSIEQASTFGWERYIGSRGKAIGMETFGASAPLKAPAGKVRVRAGARRGSGQGSPRPPLTAPRDTDGTASRRPSTATRVRERDDAKSQQRLRQDAEHEQRQAIGRQQRAIVGARSIGLLSVGWSKYISLTTRR
jgi:hypothetical protein